MGPTLGPESAARALLPGTPVLGRGDGAAAGLVTAQTQPRGAALGPAVGAYRRPQPTGQGDDWPAVVLGWEAPQAGCPQGHPSVHWRPGQEVSGAPVIRLRCDGAPGRACPGHPACTTAKGAPRPRTGRPRIPHEAMQAARQRPEATAFNARYAVRAGVESRLSQGTRRFARRRSRDSGLARPPRPQVLTAAALYGVRVIAWLYGEPLGERRRPPDPLAPWAPSPVSRQTVRCEG
jgi:Transposase DDE domain